MKERVEELLNIIKNIETNLPIKPAILGYVESLGGEYNEELYYLLVSTLGTIIRHEKALIKARGYEEIMEVSRDFQAQADIIAGDYEALEKGEPLVIPPMLLNDPELKNSED